MSDPITCRLCGEDMLFNGINYICEQCDELIECGGSLK